MEKGLIFALFAAVFFAANAITVRRATAQVGESFTATAISIFTGVTFFAIVLSFNDEWHKLSLLSWQSTMLLAWAGIIHFVAGRLLSYSAFHLIGANKASTFFRTSPLYTVILGFIFLKESLSIIVIVGILCIVGGALLISTEKKSVSENGQKGRGGTEIKGIIAALSGAFCWGLTPVLIKPAVEEIGSPTAGAFVSFAAASVVMACFFLRKQHREQIGQLHFAPATLMILGGIFSSTGQLCLYTALNLSMASIVSSLVGTNVLFTLLFSLLVNRKIEVFTLKVILGMLATVVGTLFIFY